MNDGPKSWNRLLPGAAGFFAVAPMIAGFGVLLAWRIALPYVRLRFLEAAGGLVIQCGLISFVLGVTLLAWYLWNEAGWPTVRPGRLAWEAVGIGGLLLANFPAAFLCAVFAGHAIGQARFYVINKSEMPIEQLVLVGDGIADSSSVVLGTIAPGQTVHCVFGLGSEGRINFEAKREGAPISGEIEGYAMPSSGLRASLVFEPNGTFTVHHSDH